MTRPTFEFASNHGNPPQCIVAPKSLLEAILPRSEVCSVNLSRPYTDAADWSVHDPEPTSAGLKSRSAAVSYRAVAC